MIFLSVHFFSFLFIFMGVIMFMMISDQSPLLWWVCLEMTTWGTVPFFISSGNKQAMEASFKFFLLQSISSLGLIMSIELFQLNFSLCNQSMGGSESGFPLEPFSAFFLLFFLLKSGMFPFSGWMMEIFKEGNLLIIFILSSLQKLIPIMMMMIMLINSSLFSMFKWIILLNIFISSTSLLNYHNLPFLIFFSSMYHSSIVILLLCVWGSSKISLVYFLYYVFFLGFFILFLNSWKSLNKSFMSSNKEMGFFIFFLSISGMPPYMMFFLKIFLLFNCMNFYGDFFFFLLIPAMFFYILAFLLVLFQGVSNITPVKSYFIPQNMEWHHDSNEMLLVSSYLFFTLFFLLFF